MAKKFGLGKGLDALFEDNKTDLSNTNELEINISEITPNKNQPRKDFEQSSLEELADSIKEHGVIQPLIVRPMSIGGYEIVAGERRYRACRIAGVTKVPVIIKDLDDSQTMQIALIENLQRENLNPVEEAMGYKELIDKYGYTQEKVSKNVGKSRPVIANALRLLNLPSEVVEMLAKGSISSGHARALLGLGLENQDEIIKISNLIVEKDLTVRDVEKLAQQNKTEPKLPKQKNVFYKEMEIALTNELGRKIKIIEGKRKKGNIQIEFYGEDDLKELGDKIANLFSLERNN